MAKVDARGRLRELLRRELSNDECKVLLHHAEQLRARNEDPSVTPSWPPEAFDEQGRWVDMLANQIIDNPVEDS